MTTMIVKNCLVVVARVFIVLLLAATLSGRRVLVVLAEEARRSPIIVHSSSSIMPAVSAAGRFTIRHFTLSNCSRPTRSLRSFGCWRAATTTITAAPQVLLLLLRHLEEARSRQSSWCSNTNSPFMMTAAGVRRLLATTCIPRGGGGGGEDASGADHSSRNEPGSTSSCDKVVVVAYETNHASSPAPTTGSPFHYAFPVHCLEAAQDFYGRVLGCTPGRSSEKWQDYSLHGHQIVRCIVVVVVSSLSSREYLFIFLLPKMMDTIRLTTLPRCCSC
jgi:hypothetical protein